MEAGPSSSSGPTHPAGDYAEPSIRHDGSEPSEGVENDLEKCLQDANELKLEATEHFKARNWSQALATYSMALGRLPRRVKEHEPYERTAKPEEFVEEADDQEETGKGKETSESKPESAPLTGPELECSKLRAVLNANIGACHVKLEEYKDAVKACTEALADDPHYIKALQRRASCNEKIGSWSSLASAEEDYNTLLKILPSNSPQIGPTKRALAAIKPRIEEAQKRETGEVLGKLKELGNSILGNFGLSTDNFKFEKNEQGGYSMNFVR